MIFGRNIQKQTYTKTETRKLYSTVFWNISAKCHQNLYRFKVCTFFETQCILGQVTP